MIKYLQIFGGGNRFGIKTILVTPIENNEFVFTQVKRPLEKLVLKSYSKKKGGKI